ncbi:hypothetical protein DQ04_13351010 [Trypanosoma grayi]|uniref:hypothetical protein n=1 Tax=Trypanosoma grayi TaxID=71804 RepID=UPI0004F472D3|nr:hypothetical protein DQ04_13351010 [Trypanosoma grayi]KEG06557.1 hypothetical protein DQ04_13351010 [Trypanosoma grayi]
MNAVLMDCVLGAVDGGSHYLCGVRNEIGDTDARVRVAPKRACGARGQQGREGRLRLLIRHAGTAQVRQPHFSRAGERLHPHARLHRCGLGSLLCASGGGGDRRAAPALCRGTRCRGLGVWGTHTRSRMTRARLPTTLLPTDAARSAGSWPHLPLPPSLPPSLSTLLVVCWLLFVFVCIYGVSIVLVDPRCRIPIRQ